MEEGLEGGRPGANRCSGEPNRPWRGRIEGGGRQESRAELMQGRPQFRPEMSAKVAVLTSSGAASTSRSSPTHHLPPPRKMLALFGSALTSAQADGSKNLDPEIGS